MDSLQVLALAAAFLQGQDSDKHQSPSADFAVRQARSTDIALLEYVERSAGEIFRTVGYGHLLDGPTVDPALLAYMVISNSLWVAVNRWDQPIGFAGGQNIAGNFHLVELSVAQEFQGKGIGSALMATVLDETRRDGYGRISLTTFRHIPWNAPFYSRMGFMEVNPADMGREYLEIMDHEAQSGLDMKQRCVMVMDLGHRWEH